MTIATELRELVKIIATFARDSVTKEIVEFVTFRINEISDRINEISDRLNDSCLIDIEKDAERYRWIRSDSCQFDIWSDEEDGTIIHSKDLDDVIDAAIEHEKGDK